MRIISIVNSIADDLLGRVKAFIDEAMGKLLKGLINNERVLGGDGQHFWRLQLYPADSCLADVGFEGWWKY